MKRVTTVLAAALAAAVGVANAADTVTVVSWGGAYTKSQVEAYHKPVSYTHLTLPTICSV